MENEDMVEDVVRAKQFELVDEDGKTRILLHNSSDGGVTLSLQDRSEKPRIVLMVRENGDSYVSLPDSNGQPGITIAMATQDSTEFPYLSLLREGETGLILHVSPQLRGLTVSDENSVMRVLLGLFSDGNPTLGIVDAEGRARAKLLLTESGEPVLQLLDEEGNESLTTGPG